MKKILTTALVGALVAGLAFADMGFDYTGTAIVSGPARGLGSSKGVSRNDCLSIDFSNDKAGVVFDVDIRAYDNIFTPKSPEFKLDQFYGWLTFALPVGNLQVTAGKWAGRWASRLKGDAGDLDDEFYEAHKLGTVGYDETKEWENDPADPKRKKAAYSKGIANDVDNLTKKTMATVLAYTLNDVLPGSLMIKGGLINAGDESTIGKVNYNKSTTADVNIKAGFVGELCYRQENLFKFNVAFRTPKQDQYGVGIFVSPLMLDKLGATVGFSFGLDSEEDVYDYFEYGVDLRLRYQITDKWAVTTMHNISGWSTSFKADNVEDKDDKAMWNMLSTSYKAGDNIRFVATVQNTVRSFNAKLATDSVFAITPACEISAGDHAMVTAGFDIRWDAKGTKVAPWSHAGNADISIPVYVSFSL
ncbi:MAG: hypothetical protein K2J14_07885 [Treponemataceae bacterium]|nr:hypothetical protein [Treponemataceae bacterium]